MSATARKPELLAPAGERAAAYAAFAFGADAVYTGLPRFSARAEAVNLTARDLEEIAAHAHALPGRRQVYVTLNTLIREAELPDLVRSLGLCQECGVDAIIVQDFGVARLARTHFPGLRLHASTQMAMHNLAGTRAAARLGFQRVTLARELTLAEIRAIARDTPAEIETFLHGALCYSYSGLCLYSALLRGRSGNRGACAYPCRDVFQPSFPPAGHSDSFYKNITFGEGLGGLVFSMKDLAAGESIHALVQAGVASLKIEGRMKSPLYVAAAVNYYRKLLDRSFQPGEQEQCAHDLRAIFSRPWTGLYLQSATHRDVIDPQTTGHRGTPVGRIEQAGQDFLQFRTELDLEVHDGLQIELPGETRPFGFAVEEIVLPNGRRVFEAPAGSRVQVPLPEGAPRLSTGTKLFLASSQAVKRRYRFDIPNPRDLRRRFPLDVRLVLSEARAEAIATTEADGHSLTAAAALEGPFAPARKPAAASAALQTAFSKLGDTPFELHRLDHAGPVVFIPVSQLNILRRNLATALEQQLRAARARHLEQAISSLSLLNSEPCILNSPIKPPSFLLKTDQPVALLAAFPGGDIPRVTELIVELGREPAEQMEAVVRQFPPRITLRLALPVITRDRDQKTLMAQVRRFFDAGQRLWEAANLSALEFIPRAENLDISADWPLYTLNSSALAELSRLGISRFTVAPEDTLENVASLAARHPFALVWPVHRDPPLFISESCPHAAQLGRCPGSNRCDFTEQVFVSKAGETVLTVNRNCRFTTLLAHPQVVPAPPGLPLIPRADFLSRTWDPGAIRQALRHLP